VMLVKYGHWAGRGARLFLVGTFLQPATVGGPIDVAVITKGDGFVWVKRKHYFRAELNPRFMSRYQRRKEND